MLNDDEFNLSNPDTVGDLFVVIDLPSTGKIKEIHTELTPMGWVINIKTLNGKTAPILEENGLIKTFYKLGDATLYLYGKGVNGFEVSENYSSAGRNDSIWGATCNSP